MGRTFDELDDQLTAWIDKQHMFFVSTAPNDPSGLVNVSPKGAKGTFRLLGPTSCAYLDLVGSGVETIAHLRENGRIVVMFCAFEGPPKVLRLHGKGRIVQDHDPEFAELVEGFAPSPDLREILRSVIVVDITRIGDSCGFVVPKMQFVEERDQLVKWGQNHANHDGDGWKQQYLAVNNRQSLDGLPGLDVSDSPTDQTANVQSRFSSAGKAL